MHRVLRFLATPTGTPQMRLVLTQQCCLGSGSRSSGPIREVMTARGIRVRYASSCELCGTAVAVGERAWWDATTKTVRCQACSSGDATSTIEQGCDPEGSAALDLGVAGGSARSEYERRRQRREDAVHARHPRLGRLIVAATVDDAQIGGVGGASSACARCAALCAPPTRCGERSVRAFCAHLVSASRQFWRAAFAHLPCAK
jgi:hypothetical protein